MKFYKNKYLISIIIFFGIIYSLISLVNHYNFRTYALDLGLYTNAMYDYIHFRFNDSSVFKEISENLLADHFDLYLMFFSPLTLVFGTYTLLIVQILSILFGGIGIYKYFTIENKNSKIPLFATLYFYLFFGIFTSLSFDYHSNVVAAMLVPWFFYFFNLKKYNYSFLFLLLIIISKENISLWLTFICIGLLIKYRKDNRAKKYLFIFSTFSIIYFILITSFVMPSLSYNGTYHNFVYTYLGKNSFEVLINIISHPFRSFRMLFINHLNEPNANYIKLELHILLFVAGLYMLFFKPYYIIMLVPVYFQKLFHDNFSMWGVNSHYTIEFIPIITIGIFSVISNIKNHKLVRISIIMVLIGSIACTIRVMDRTIYFTDKANIRLYKKSHYIRDYNVKAVHEQINLIPKEAIVSAQTQFVPHLALRDKIYQFPIIKDAQFIIYSPKEGYYPLSKEEFEKKIHELNVSNKWKVQFENADLVILKSNLKSN